MQASGSKQKMADAVVSYLDIEAEIRQRIALAHEVQRDILSTIEQLSEPEYDVLHKVYIQDMILKEVASSRGKSKSWADTLHGRALFSVQKILDKRK